uniref:Protein kinase domain-containing protein n=1 Tax=viral metagenome TaxID=1070528 RepID=A0A6C0CIX0_9ZZZZ
MRRVDQKKSLVRDQMSSQKEYGIQQDAGEKKDQVVPLMRQQLHRELELILSRKTCHLRRKFKDANDFRAEIIKHDLSERFYDANFMATLYCTFDAVIHLPVEDGDGLDASHEIVSELFRDLRRIGAESVNGNAIMSSLNQVKDMFVIKTPKKPGNDELLHELFVGFMATNGLRRKCPNFAYILGGYKCLPPVINSDKSVSSWCATNAHPEDYVNYIIYEKVDGKSLADHLSKCTFEQFFSWYVQLLLAIQIGSDSVGFTHYDLHDENVMLRPWMGHEKIAIPYKVPSGATWYVHTDFVATMIDFGMTHVEVNREHFGKYGLESWGTFADQSRPLYDVYKILGFSIGEMLRTRNKKCARRSLGFLRILVDTNNEMTDDELIDMVKEEGKTLHVFSVKRLRSENSYDLWDYLKETKDRYPREWKDTVTTTEPTIPVLACLHACLTKRAAEEEIGGDQGMAKRETESDMKIVKAAPQSKRAALAKARLPENIHKLRQEMRKEHAKLVIKLADIHNLSSSGIPKIADSTQLQHILEVYVEPNVNFRDHYASYLKKQSVLNDYYLSRGETLESSEFDLGPQLQEWNRNYEQIYNKLNNLIVAAPNQATQNYMVSLMKT